MDTNTKNDLDTSSFSNHKILALILLIVTTILWGSSFIIAKQLTQEVPIFVYLSLRFIISLIGFVPFLIKMRNVNKEIIWMGIISGIIYYFAIAFQTYGLQTTSAGKAAFITGLATIMVPFFIWIFFKKNIVTKKIWIAAALTIIGMGFLLLEGNENVLIGDILVLICAIFCAFFIIYNDKFVRIVDVYLYTIVQLFVIALLCISSSLILNEGYDITNMSINLWFIIIYMGFIVTFLTFIFTNWSQQHQEASQTAIIFALEPVFAVIFASFLIGNEILSWQTWLGCGLIFVAILITVVKNDNLFIEEK
ncbi:MAG: DMT family transporter [Candidatus Hermodarchaeota archaeon]